MRTALARIVAVVSAVLLPACWPTQPTSRNATVTVTGTPASIGDGWPLSDAASEGLDTARIAALSSSIAAGQYGQVDGLVIARNGRLCFDGYYRGTAFDLHELQSVTKSVTSALIGAAIARGAIPGLDAPVISLLPEFAAAAESDSAKGRIHVQHLLTMSSGLDWDEMSFPNGDPRNTLTQMNTSADWVGYVVSRRAVEVPGLRFVYNSGGTILLGAILRATTGQDVVAFANDALFAPLGIRNQTWTRNQSHPDQVHTGGGLALRPRDAAKIGLLYLDEGVWEGRQVLPAAWVRDSLQPHLAATDGAQYGFNWWVRTATGGVNIGEAWGARGQHVFVVPARRLVVVVTARDERIDAGRQILDVVI